MSFLNYGIYLIPPPEITVAIGQAHQLFASEFNAPTGGRFMVHCTVKGFFKMKDGTSPQKFLPELDKLFDNFNAFPTRIESLRAVAQGAHGPSIVVLLEKSKIFQQLHEAVWDIVRPYIAEDCRFSPVEGAGPNFRPHLTLAMADLPPEPGLMEQAIDLGQYLYDYQLPKQKFTAQNMQLIEFHSEDWSGHWWETLRYNQLKGWKLR